MYPSNIVASIDSKMIKEKILKNIASVSPVLTIHTNKCEKHHRPEKSLLITDQEPSAVQAALFQSKLCIDEVAKIPWMKKY